MGGPTMVLEALNLFSTECRPKKGLQVFLNPWDRIGPSEICTESAFREPTSHTPKTPPPPAAAIVRGSTSFIEPANQKGEVTLRRQSHAIACGGYFRKNPKITWAIRTCTENHGQAGKSTATLTGIPLFFWESGVPSQANVATLEGLGRALELRRGGKGGEWSGFRSTPKPPRKQEAKTSNHNPRTGTKSLSRTRPLLGPGCGIRDPGS